MNICHITRYCHVDGKAGTERYILELARALKREGHSGSIAWLCGQQPPPEITPEETPVLLIPSPPAQTDQPDARFESQFTASVLAAHRPDVAHFHTFGVAEQRIAALLTREGIPYVFTYHSPAWSCRRETMLRWGDTLCDGEVRTLRCSACKLQQRTNASTILSYAGATLSGMAGLPARLLPSGKLQRRTAFVADTRRFRMALRTFLNHASHVIACAPWSIPVLERNGAHRERITHLPQGVPTDFVDAAESADDTPTHADTFTVGYIGRVTSVKGVHVLVDAFARCNYPKARLRLFGWQTDNFSQAYVNKVADVAKHDPRIETVPILAFEQMIDAYRQLSLVAIPSTSPETGPLVLLEALALNIPVWGSSRLGQQSLLQDYGRVIEPNTVDAWQQALEKAFKAHADGHILRPPSKALDDGRMTRMADVGRDMVDIYARAVQDKAS
ncbi:MAG: glycosyltransferase involved in cell wall biosynthesis [Candidatus Promineifilaceae bacterium]|jgi:glycosyltransferase involved in cell wall biosynthesis